MGNLKVKEQHNKGKFATVTYANSHLCVLFFEQFLMRFWVRFIKTSTEKNGTQVSGFYEPSELSVRPEGVLEELSLLGDGSVVHLEKKLAQAK